MGAASSRTSWSPSSRSAVVSNLANCFPGNQLSCSGSEPQTLVQIGSFLRVSLQEKPDMGLHRLPVQCWLPFAWLLLSV